MNSKEKILLTFLGSIFLGQILMLGVTVNKCFEHIDKYGFNEHPCPGLEKRASGMFAGMTATTLALLTGIQIKKKDQ
jgi:hypothetical protein